MPMQVVNLNCPGCGEPVDTSQPYCKYCGRKVLVSSFGALQSLNPMELNRHMRTYQKADQEGGSQDVSKALGLCQLKLKLFDKAAASFEKACDENYEDSEVYYYQAVALLKGKKPFLHVREEINKMMELIQAASMIEQRGIYTFFMAYIKQDYFARKCFIISPDWQQELADAKNIGIANGDVDMFVEMTGLQLPEELSIY